MFRLITDGSPSGQPVLKLGWCLDEATRSLLVARKAVNVHVLLVSVERGGREKRQLLRLEDGMTYTTFNKPGQHKVFAALVWPEAGKSKADLWVACMSRNRHGYEHSVVSSHYDDYFFEPHSLEDVECISNQTAELNVEVDGGHFAKTPTGWLAKWASFLTSKPLDQCGYRRRLIFAFTLQPIVVAWMSIWRTLLRTVWMTIGLLFACRVRVKPLLHPFSRKIGQIWDPSGEDRNFFTRDSNGQKRELGWFYQFFIPAVWIGTFGAVGTFITFMVTNKKVKGHWHFYYVHSFKTALWLTPCLILGFVALIGIIGVVVTIFDQIRASNRKISWKRPKPVEPSAEEIRGLQERLAGLVACGEVTTINELAVKPTIRLRYLDLKAKVCKPFANV